jgi:DNA-binding CsgD family transcriptional regulator
VELIGRRAECETLDRLLTEAFAGQSGVLVLRGEAGIGKTALLDHLIDRAAGSRILRARGVESEMELAYSGLHQLCRSLLDRLDDLPVPQRDALATVFGLGEGPAPDRFLVGLATLTLFAEAADEQPLVCVVDDAQWLDQASAQTLAFVGHRLLADRVALVCASRRGIGDSVLAGLPELSVDELGDGDALALLLGGVQGPLDAAVCQRIVAESHGNPLALLEFPRSWNVTELAGGFGLPDSLPVSGKIEEAYARRLELLPADAKLLVLAAAAEPVGDPALLQRAATSLGVDMAAADAATDAGLLIVAERVEFTHPLVRSATYRSAAADDRRRVHRALADATDVETDPDRRAWHRARAARGPDEDVAAELQRSAGRAQGRGGVAAAAAFLQRSVTLTQDPARRAERALAAAETSLQAGAFDEALRLVAIAENEELDEFQRARVDLLRGHLAFLAASGRDAPSLLLHAARSLEAFDIELARETYLIAWFASTVVGHVAGGDVMLEICHAVQALPRRPGAPQPLHLLLEGLVLLTTEGHVAATPVLQRAAAELMSISAEDVRRWGWAAPAASSAVWDDEGHLTISARNLQIVRDAGAFAELPQHLLSFGVARAWIGDFAGVATVLAEAESIEAATGRYGGYLLPMLRALQGREAEASALIAGVVEQAALPGRAGEADPVHWAAAVLSNGLARYEEAKSAAEQATWNRFNPWFAKWALAELVEAAARLGDADLARDALERLAETTQPAGTDFALGIEARCRALLADGDSADVLYREAVERLERRQLRPDQARAHLLYGEWLRREGRRVDAREQLRTAYEMFVTIGMDAFAERARRELTATGEKVRKRSPETRDELTPQEEQIARLARDGLTNTEIGTQLYISPRTVEWHLRKVFTKLGIMSRRQLRTAIPQADPARR